MSTTTFVFEDLDLLPPQDGYEAGILVNGVVHIDYARSSGNWVVAAIDIRHLKLIEAPSGLPADRTVAARLAPAPPHLLADLIRGLSTPRWRAAIQAHVDEVRAEEASDARIEAGMRMMEP